MDKDKLVVSMTVGELFNALKELAEEDARPAEERPHYVHGRIGLAEGLGVSQSTAQRIKNSGIIDDAIFQRSPKSYVTDIEKAKKIINQTYKSN